jgi:hypothetical protein
MMELTTDEILKLTVPVVMVAIAFVVRKNRRFEGRIIKWWVLLILGLILLVLRLVRIFYLS